jgi:hypothetical protein
MYTKNKVSKLGRAIDQSDDLKPMSYAQKMGVKPNFVVKNKR